MRLIFLLVGLLGIFLFPATGRSDPPPPEWVFFDMPTNLITGPIPEPTAQLLAVPGYPNDSNRMTLVGHVYTPDTNNWGSGPWPSVFVLHGSGGMWSSDMIPNGPASQFEDWAEALTDAGFLCLLADSYNPRGIPENFAGRRPSFDPAVDDALASPNYERPKDVVAILDYLITRSDVDIDHIGLLG
ncbi:MAG: hypothetical protein AAF492_31735, partial [Verrucomicrobiota bacterium]